MKTNTMILGTSALVVLGIGFSAIADGESSVMAQKSFALKHAAGSVHVMVKKDSHTIGRPYKIELRAVCGSQSASPTRLPIEDTESVCDVQPESVKLSEDGRRVTVMIRETDSERFNKQSRSASAAGLKALEPICKNKGKEFSFNVEDYCR